MSGQIKLIACDIDGTLVDSKKRIPGGLYEAVHKLRDHGIIFVIASGRQYYNVAKTFAAIKDVITILSENGSMLIDDNGAFFTSEIPQADVVEIMRETARIPTAQTILCGVKAAYTLPSSEVCRSDIGNNYERRVIAENAFDLAAQDIICKVAVFDHESSAKNVAPVLAHFADHLNPNLSGDHWIDVMNQGIDKGSGMRILLDRFGVKPEECMCFGDYDNDIGMLKVCGESYAMANATDAVKAVCKHLAPSNDEAGVMQVLYREFPFLRT